MGQSVSQDKIYKRNNTKALATDLDNRQRNQNCSKTLQLHEDRSFQQARAQNMKVSNDNRLRMQIRACKPMQNNESVYDARQPQL